MNDQSICYLWENGQRVAIPYGELKNRRASDPGFRRRRFWLFDGALLEVTEEQYQQLRKEANHQNYLSQQAQGINICSITTDSVAEQDLLWGAPSEDFEECVVQRIMRESMGGILVMLSDEEQALVRTLFYEGVTERTLAERWSLTHGAIHQRKLKLLEKLRALLKVE